MRPPHRGFFALDGAWPIAAARPWVVHAKRRVHSRPFEASFSVLGGPAEPGSFSFGLVPRHAHVPGARSRLALR